MTTKSKPPFLIDTKTACFLCLRECSENSLNKLFSFKTLSRYLKINLEKTLGSSYGYQTLLLCPDCYDEAQRFSRLYQELELIKMLIHSSLTNIHAKMKDARESGRRMRRYKEIMQCRGFGSVSQLEFVEGIQTEMITKCEMKFRKMLPKVRVPKWEGGPVSMATTSGSSLSNGVALEAKDSKFPEAQIYDSIDSEAVIKEEEPLILSSYSLAEVEGEPGTSSGDIEFEIESEPVSKHFENDARNSSSPLLTESSATTDFNCDYCNKSFLESSFVQDHTIGSHADQLFRNYKHPNLTPLQFRLALERFLHENVNSKHSSNVLLKTSSCEFCDFRVPQAERFCLRRHLVDEHFEVMTQRLARFQEENFEHLSGLNSEDPKDIFNCILKLVNIVNCKKVFGCTLCGSTVTENCSKDHLRTHGYCAIKCRFCEETFVRSTCLRFHEMRRHSDIILASLNINLENDVFFADIVFKTLDDILCLQSEPSKKNKCPLCPDFSVSVNTVQGMTWRRHMLTNHFQFTAKKIIDAQFDYLREAVDCKCRHCGEKFKDEASFRAHLDTHIAVPPEFTLNPTPRGASKIRRSNIYVRKNCDKCGALISYNQLAAHQKSAKCKARRLQYLSRVKIKMEDKAETIPKPKPRNLNRQISARKEKLNCESCGTIVSRRCMPRHKRNSCRPRINFQSVPSLDSLLDSLLTKPVGNNMNGEEGTEPLQLHHLSDKEALPSSSFADGKAAVAESEMVLVGGDTDSDSDACDINGAGETMESFLFMDDPLS